MLPRPLQVLLAFLRVAAGISLLAPGIRHVGWLANPTLSTQLAQWSSHTTQPLVAKYLAFVTPHANVLARVVVAGELILGAMLILGFLTPLAAALAFLMVANFHFASGAILSLDYVTGQDGLVYLFVFPVLLLGRAGLALGADGVMGKRMSGGGGGK